MKGILYTTSIILIASACGEADLGGDLKQFIIKAVIATILAVVATLTSKKKKSLSFEEKLWREVAAN